MNKQKQEPESLSNQNIMNGKYNNNGESVN